MAQATEAPAEEVVQLNFPNEIELKVLADYVSERMQVLIFYDETINGKRVTIRARQPIPVSSLLDVLQSALRMKGMALVDAGTPGWKRITTVTKFTEFAQIHRPGMPDPGVPVTQMFSLNFANPDELTQVVTPLLTQPGGNSIAVSKAKLLIVTDYSGNIDRVREIITAIDRPGAAPVMEFYLVKNLPAEEILASALPMLRAGGGASEAVPIQLMSDPRTNQVSLIGLPADIVRARSLLEKLDVSLGLETFVYQFRNASADRVDKILQEIIDPLEKKTSYRSTVDAEANLLIVRTTPEIHGKLAELQRKMDVAPESSRSPVRILKLKNANANEVLQTLQSIGMATGEGMSGASMSDGTNLSGETLSEPSAANMQQPLGITQQMTTVNPFPVMTLPLPGFNSSRDSSRSGLVQRPSVGGAVLPGNVRVSADPLTNSLIIVGDPAIQAPYLEMIEKLDRRRPQVMIEAHIIAIDTSDNCSIGVEVSFGDRSGVNRLFQFTSFGLSEVDPLTGALQIIPNLGFNGALVNPDVADAVVQALATHSRARVLASPKILVNDNTRGRFENVLSIPFQSVNASQTVSTTSYGGSQDAGTTIDVTPHIKEGNELELEFDVEFSAFSGSAASSAVPPPRQVSKAESIITVPDGHTVIVGGLKQIGENETFTGIPFLETIPIIRDLTSLQTRGRTTTSFFLFLKPQILRDDQFAGLKYLSDKDGVQSGFQGRFPTSSPRLIRCVPEDQ